jgi:hypothetical protein
MKFDIEKLDKKLKDKICRAIEESFYNVMRIKLPKEIAWNFVVSLFKELKQSSSNYVEELLDTAKIDLEASRVLYNNKLYPNSVYFLQQSVEKTTKAFVLWTRLVGEKELYGKKKRKSILERILSTIFRRKEEAIDHISPKAFILLLRRKPIRIYVSLWQQQIEDPTLKNRLKNLNKEIIQFERIINKKEKIAKISRVEIEAFLKTCDLYKDSLAKIDKRRLKSQINLLNQSITKRLRDILSSEYMNEIDKINNVLKKVEYKIEDLFIGAKSLIFLYFLSIITYPHFSYTRYPSKEMGPKDYNESLGIVQTLERIIQVLDETIKDLEKSMMEGI